MNLRNKIYLAGLLHDIGKFYQRAGRKLTNEFRNLESVFCPSYQGKYSRKHVLWTVQFIEEILNVQEPGEEFSLIRLASAHHKPSNNMETIIQLADHYASGMDRNSNNNSVRSFQDVVKTPINSIFENLGEENDNLPNYKLCLQEMKIDDSIFPTQNYTITRQEYETLWKQFENEVGKTIGTGDIINNKNLIDTLYFILKNTL